MMRRIAVALGLVLVLGVPAVAGAAVTPEYFTLPTGYTGSSFGVAADAQGNIWFGGKGPDHTSPSNPMQSQPTPSLIRLTPSQAVAGTSTGLVGFPTPDDPSVNCCANQLRSLTYNTVDHKLYWVRSDGHIGSGDPTGFQPGTIGGMTTYRLPGNQDLWDVAAADGPGVWLTEKSASNVGPNYYGDRIGFSSGGAPTEGPNIAIQNGQTSLNSLRYDAKPSGITVGPDGKPWFVEEDPGNPGYRIATYSGVGPNYEEYLISPCEGTSPCSGSYTGTGLTDLAFTSDGGLWFTNVINHKFGRFDLGTHQMVQYTMASLGLGGGDPRSMTAAPDGTVWMTSYQFSGGSASALVQISPPAQANGTPTFTVYKTPGITALGLGADNAGNLWFTTTGSSGISSQVGRLAGVIGGTPPGGGGGGGGGGTTTTPPTTTGGGGGGTGVTPTPGGGIVVKPAPISVGTARPEPPQVGNGAINTNQICVGPPESRCSVVYLVREHEYVQGFPSAAGKKKPKKKQPRTLATKTVTLKGGESRKVTITLNKLGMRILKGKGKLKFDYIVTQKLDGGKTKTLSRKTLTMKYKKPKKGKQSAARARAAAVKRGYYIEVKSQTYIQTNKAATKIARFTLPCTAGGQSRGSNILTSVKLSKTGAFTFDGKSTLRGITNSVIKLKVKGKIVGNKATAKVTYSGDTGCDDRSINAKYYGVNPQG
jgi:streptogramin lyase